MEGTMDLEEEKLATEKVLASITEQGKLCNDMVVKLKEQLDTKNLSMAEGTTFLEVKNELLLQYLISLTGLTLQKVSGKSIKNSPYLNQLVESRAFMEKMKPIEKKLKYQLDKFVGTAVQGSDAMKYRANLDDLERDDNEDDFNSDDDDEDDDSDSGKKTLGNTNASKSGIYRPPKVAPTHFDEEEGERPKTKSEQNRKKSINPALIRDLQEEYLDTPMEIHNMGDAYAKQLSRDVRDKQRYEETFMTRLPVTKKEKHRDNTMSTIGVLGDEITDFAKKNSSSQSNGKGKKRKFFNKNKKGGSKKFRKH